MVNDDMMLSQHSHTIGFTDAFNARHDSTKWSSCSLSSTHFSQCHAIDMIWTCTRSLMQVRGSGAPPHFRLHIQPGSPAQLGSQCAQLVSRAGEGKGLQVFPGSVTEVTAPEVSCGYECTVQQLWVVVRPPVCHAMCTASGCIASGCTNKPCIVKACHSNSI